MPVVWHLAGGRWASTPGCGGAAPVAYPWPSPSGRGLGWNEAQRTEFEVAADGVAGDVLPRGTWFVEGTVLWKRTPSPPCAALPVGWRLTLLTAGDVQFERSAAIRPSSPRGVSVVTGRDLVLTSGAEVSSCDESAAFLVHEQVSIGSSETLEGQLIADDRGTCSPRASGSAIVIRGGGVVRVPSFPPVPLPRDLMRVRSSPAPW